MHLGIFAKTFPRPRLEETLDAIVNHGLWHMQFNMSCVGLPTLPERIDEEYCRSIARALRERGLTMAAISGTFNLGDPNPLRLLDNLRRLDLLAAACRWLDTRIITLCTGTLDPDDMWRWHSGNVRRSTWQNLIESTRLAVNIADRHEVTLAFEPEINNIVNSVCKARKLLDEIGSPWLKVVIDPANLIRPGELPRLDEVLDEAFDWLGPDIVLAHAKNPTTERDSAQGAPTEWSSVPADLQELLSNFGLHWIRAEMGLEQAETQTNRLSHFFSFYFSYFKGLKRIGYGGSVVIHGLPEGEVGPVAHFLTQMLLWLDRDS